MKNAIDQIMNKKMIIIAVALIAVLGIGAALMLKPKPPSIQAVKENPALFKLSDYKDKVALHTRLTTLFPRGSSHSTVEEFMNRAAIQGMQNDGQRCTYSADYGAARFIYGLNDDRLVSVHIIEGGQIWPEFRESCSASAQELTPTAPQNETPIILPLEPLDIAE